jgi:hypothetical protein
MTDQRITVDELGEHHFLVTFPGGEEPVQTRIQGSADVLAQLGLQDRDEPLVVQATAAFLLERQLAIDLPAVIDIEDVVAGYDDYLDEIRRRMGDSVS